MVIIWLVHINNELIWDNIDWNEIIKTDEEYIKFKEELTNSDGKLNVDYVRYYISVSSPEELLANISNIEKKFDYENLLFVVEKLLKCNYNDKENTLNYLMANHKDVGTALISVFLTKGAKDDTRQSMANNFNQLSLEEKKDIFKNVLKSSSVDIYLLNYLAESFPDSIFADKEIELLVQNNIINNTDIDILCVSMYPIKSIPFKHSNVEEFYKKIAIKTLGEKTFTENFSDKQPINFDKVSNLAIKNYYKRIGLDEAKVEPDLIY